MNFSYNDRELCAKVVQCIVVTLSLLELSKVSLCQGFDAVLLPIVCGSEF